MGKRGGKQPGAGRPPGLKNKKTLEREKVQEAINNRIFAMADKLISAQQIQALGTHKMVRMFKDEMGKPSVETIRDEKRMQKLLDEGQYGKDYVIVVGTLPEYKAADALLNRGFGKPAESLKLEGNVTFTLRGLAERRQMIKAEEEQKLLDENK